jgi:hypothetical protein
MPIQMQLLHGQIAKPERRLSYTIKINSVPIKVRVFRLYYLIWQKLFDRAIDGMISCDNQHQYQELNIRFLLDTGALQANYRSLDLANKLRKSGCFYQDAKNTVCSPIMKCKCIESRGLISFRLKYLNFAVGRYETIYIEARVLDIGCDLILGLPTIKTNDLVTIFAHLFSAADISHAINLANRHNTQDTTQSISPRSVL